MAQRIATARSTLSDFVATRIAELDPVGSRELELHVEKLRERGMPIIPVYGYPVVQAPDSIAEVAREAAKVTASAPSNGIPELRGSLARVLGAQYNATFDPDREILVTCGAMHALHVVLTALLEPGDEVLLLTPCYFFGGLIQVAGARAVRVATEEEDGFAIDFDKIRRNISERTKVIMVSSPVNPTGYVYTRQDVEQFISIAEEYNLLLVSDESYDRLLYDGREHISPFHYPEGRKRTILVKSFTKSYGLHNWRVGYIVADSSLVPYFRVMLEWTVLYCPYVNQRVALEVLNKPQAWLLDVFRNFESSRNRVIESIRNSEAYSCLKPQGGPFLFVNVSRLSQNNDGWARRLLEYYGIPAVPGKYFHSPLQVRIPFGGTEDAVTLLVNALLESGRLPR